MVGLGACRIGNRIWFVLWAVGGGKKITGKPTRIGGIPWAKGKPSTMEFIRVTLTRYWGPVPKLTIFCNQAPSQLQNVWCTACLRCRVFWEQSIAKSFKNPYQRDQRDFIHQQIGRDAETHSQILGEAQGILLRRGGRTRWTRRVHDTMKTCLGTHGCSRRSRSLYGSDVGPLRMLLLNSSCSCGILNSGNGRSVTDPFAYFYGTPSVLLDYLITWCDAMCLVL